MCETGTGHRKQISITPTLLLLLLLLLLLYLLLLLLCLQSLKLHKNIIDKNNIFKILKIKSRIMRWTGHVARMGEERGAYRALVGKPEGKRPLGRPRRRWVDNIRMDLREVECGYVDWIGLA